MIKPARLAFEMPPAFKTLTIRNQQLVPLAFALLEKSHGFLRPCAVNLLSSNNLLNMTP
jgi:hypothetical protein